MENRGTGKARNVLTNLERSGSLPAVFLQSSKKDCDRICPPLGASGGVVAGVVWSCMACHA